MILETILILRFCYSASNDVYSVSDINPIVNVLNVDSTLGINPIVNVLNVDSTLGINPIVNVLNVDSTLDTNPIVNVLNVDSTLDTNPIINVLNVDSTSDINPMTDSTPDTNPMVCSTENVNEITILNFSHKNLSIFPDEITEYTNLKSLYLSQNNIISIPSTITKLTKLETLDLSGNNLKSFSSQLNKLPNLTTLNISHNFLITLDDSFGKIKNLQILYISRNHLTSLPHSFTSLKNLKGLNLLCNKLKSLPPDFGNLKKLEWINLACNQIETLPESIGNLTNLEELSIQRNSLKSFPESIGKLFSLSLFDASFNFISKLQPSIGNLIDLKKIYLDQNLISEIPRSLGGLKNLRELVISSNQISSVPFSFKNLKMIERLDLRNNMIRKRGIGDSLGAFELKEIFGDRVSLDDENCEFNKMIDETTVFKELKSKTLCWNFNILKTLKFHETVVPSDITYEKTRMFLILSDFCFNRHISIECRDILQEYIEYLWIFNENQNRWSISPSIAKTFRDHMGFILNNLDERKNNGELDLIEFCLANIAWAVKYSCIEDQLYEMQIACSILSNTLTLDNFVNLIVSIEKTKIFDMTILPAKSILGNDLISFWKNKTSNILGFESNRTSVINDPFENNRAAVLDAFFSKFTPEYIVNVILQRINSSNTLLYDLMRNIKKDNFDERDIELTEIGETNERMMMFSKFYSKYRVTSEMVIEFLVEKKIIFRFDPSDSVISWMINFFYGFIK